jgi:1,4-dihydroxy-2-naphthoate octaprenyltransferase
LQILSNFANDYGDGVKGTDNEDRVGPKRAIQSGIITPAMKGNNYNLIFNFMFCYGVNILMLLQILFFYLCFISY